MDDQKDIFIKQKLQKDDLISKKADDIFTNFFKEEIDNMKEEEKVVNFEKSKDKNKGKRFLTAVASCAIILVGANVYASTQGYGNIFFMIKSAITGTEITNKDELLKDREITISYQPIEIADGVEIQINKLTVENGKGKLDLYVKVDGAQKSNIPVFYKVYDMSNNNSLIGEKQDKSNDSYFKEVQLKNMKETTDKLKLELLNEEKQTLFVAEIDLNSKEINVLESAQKEIEKISEVELKKVLGLYSGLNEYDDLKLNTILSERQWKNNKLLEIVTHLVTEDGTTGDFNYKYYSLNKVNKAIKEITEKTPDGILDLGNSYLIYDDTVNGYRANEASGGDTESMCLEIKDLSYSNGVYRVTFIYCHPAEGNYADNQFEDLEQFETTMKFKLNDNYEYTKYCLVDYENIESKPSQESTINNSNNKLDKSKILGDWEPYKAEKNGKEIELNEIWSAARYGGYLTFNEDGTYSELIGADRDLAEEAMDRIKNKQMGKYEFSDNSINLTSNDGTVTKIEVIYENGKMVLKEQKNDMYAYFEKAGSDISKIENTFRSAEQCALEYRDSSKITNYKDFNYDLDGDGKVDKITIRRSNDLNNPGDFLYDFELNGTKFDTNYYSSLIVYIIDLDKNDNKLEFLTYDDGPSDDPGYTIYEKDGNNMKKISTIGGPNIVINENGKIKSKTTILNFIEPDIYDEVYTLNNGQVTLEKIDAYKDVYCKVKGFCCITKNLDNIEKYLHAESDWDNENESHSSLLNRCEIYELDENSSFKIKSILNDTQALIEYNGEEYYLLSYDGNFAG